MATAFDIITSALKLVGVLADGETPSDDTANQGLSVFNDMIDAWNADRLAIFTTRSDDFPLILNQQSYTLGTGGNFNIPRPARIDAMSSILLTNPANPVEVPITMFSVEDWQTKVPVKAVNGSFPLICYDDGDFPLRNLSFWPIPTQQQNSVRIYGWQALPAQTLLAQVSFPPGYAEAIRYNLAARLGAEFNAPTSPVVVQLAIQGLARVKTMNAPELSLQSDLIPSPAGYNYRADLFGMGF
ncbi:hypothetical protein P8936_16500 [Edaphobacter paludis]|uniref:Uncharacterized protein n=1 Tax=Edaphobacter paludis TaxID=3035702 RepID=A0AAU7D5F0_9BACT